MHDTGAFRIADPAIELRLSTPFEWKRQPVIVFRHTDPTRHY
jgi:hypothetical protein